MLFSKRTLHSQSETRITTRFTKEKDTYNLSDFWMNADDYAANGTSKDAEKIWKEVSKYEEQILSFLAMQTTTWISLQSLA